jgi:hypothetical protein
MFRRTSHKTRKNNLSRKGSVTQSTLCGIIIEINAFVFCFVDKNFDYLVLFRIPPFNAKILHCYETYDLPDTQEFV